MALEYPQKIYDTTEKLRHTALHTFLKHMDGI